jgi:hypothetical protein
MIWIKFAAVFAAVHGLAYAIGRKRPPLEPSSEGDLVSFDDDGGGDD